MDSLLGVPNPDWEFFGDLGNMPEEGGVKRRELGGNVMPYITQ